MIFPFQSKVSTLFIGTIQPQVFCAAACAVSLQGCVHGLSQSMGNDDLRYNSEAKWRYLEGGETNVSDGIKDVESITTADEVNVPDGIQDVESITTTGNSINDRRPLSSNISLFSDPWQHALKRAREYGHS